MNSEILYNEILTYCQANASAELAAKYQRYFKQPYNGYGLTNPMITEKVKELMKNKEITLDIAMQTLSKYLCKGKYEEVAFGLLLVNGRSKDFTRETFNQIEGLFSKCIDNWAHADTLGMLILPKFIAKNIVELADFIPWLESPYKFQRRCVPVTFIKPMKTIKECSVYMKIIETLMEDKEREVHQGVGWFLREAWKIQPIDTEAFLLKWKEIAPRLIFQYACEKMEKEERLRFRRTKK
ncbi:MAG: DNA alkylation repair protein [Candidatus Kapabacteria bacterium]|nr:DNA alkylation repair protein [Candidatus Kapabacteria bacterium]